MSQFNLPVNGVSMTTVEISELTGKRHDHVLRDTRYMLLELYGENALPKFGERYKAADNNIHPCYRLPQTEIPAPAADPAQTPAPTLAQDQAADKPDVLEIIALHRKAGLTWPKIATALNDDGILTARGGAWTGPNCQTFFKRSNK